VTLHEAMIDAVELLRGFENIALRDRKSRFKYPKLFLRISLSSGYLLIQSLCMITKYRSTLQNECLASVTYFKEGVAD
jgi:hypothetical protein